MGIHNEAGVEKIKLPKSKDLMERMLKMVTDTSDSDRAYVPFKHDGEDEVVLLVNNLGGMSELEMTSIANDAVLTLEETKIAVKRIMVGSVMVSSLFDPFDGRILTFVMDAQTSLNLPGFSLTCLLLPREGDKYSSERVLQVLDAPASSPGWKFMYNGPPGKPQTSEKASDIKQVRPGGKPVARMSNNTSQSGLSADLVH